MILQVKNLCYRYSKKAPNVLEDITYTFNKNTMYSIIGHSGSGKTTLMSIIAKLDKPTQGSILYSGSDVKRMNANYYRSRCVSVIFQQYNLLTNYTAIDNVIMALNIVNYNGDKTKRAIELLHEVKLPENKLTNIARHLSGGEQQRLAIARALATDAEVILADEPTGNLDNINTKNVMDLFNTLKDKYKKCVIVVTHSDAIVEYADCVINIEQGRLVL